jgi:hypothetical protein
MPKGAVFGFSLTGERIHTWHINAWTVLNAQVLHSSQYSPSR